MCILAAHIPKAKMSTVKKILELFSWPIVVFLQWYLGYFGGLIVFMIAPGNLLAYTVVMWIVVSLLVFYVGTLNLTLRRSLIREKNYIRLGYTSLGVFIPFVIIYILDGFVVNADHQIIDGIDTPSGILLLISPVIGLIGFYIPSWVEMRKKAKLIE